MVEQRQMTGSKMVGPTRSGPGVPVAAISREDVFGILRRHVVLIVALTVLGLILGGAGWYLFREYLPRFEAETYIEVLAPVETDPMTIGGALVQKDILYGFRLSMANLIKQQSTLLKLLDRDKIQQTEWFRRFAKIQGGRIINRDRCFKKAFKDLKRHFGVQAHRDADFITLSMNCAGRDEAALIVNEMMDLFVNSQGSTQRAEVVERLKALEMRRNGVSSELTVARRALEDVRQHFQFTDLDQPVGAYIRHTLKLSVDDLQLKQNELKLVISQMEADITNLQELAEGSLAVQVKRQIENDWVMITLGQRIAFAESILAGQLTRFGENHRVVRQTQEQIDKIGQEKELRRQEIGEQQRQANLKDAEDLLLVLQERDAELEKMRQDTEARKKDLDRARVQYEERMRRVDEIQEQLLAVNEQILKLQMMHEDPQTPKVQRVGYAPAPLEMVASRQWWVWFPGGTVLGLMLGIGLAFLVELLNDLVRTPRDVGRHLHIPLLGVIPDASEDRQVRDVDVCHVLRQAPYSITSESYRLLRTNLSLSDSVHSSKVLLVSSGMPGDGKTCVAVNLATSLVAEDKRVLLVDANLRRPSLETVFMKSMAEGGSAEDVEAGLSELLTGVRSYEDVVKTNIIEGLDVICAGQMPSNPAELLGNAKMHELVREQRENYDYVIIDSPPVLLVSDAKVLAKLADGTILVFNAGVTRRGAAQRTIRELREVNAVIAGCVLFAVQTLKGGYFQEQFKSYREYQKLQIAHSI